MTTISDAKRMAKALRSPLASRGVEISHSESLELVAAQLGYRDWNTAAARLGDRPAIKPGIPVFRSFSEQKAREFYVDFLGFSVDWEHRFEPGMPLYMAVSRSELTLHLSEHYGDGTPGSSVWVPVADVRALHAEFNAKHYENLRPGIDPDSPGGPTMDLIDPFGNTLRFCQQEPSSEV
jgi:catechol 2,3-dioxygenase-like lactoylglutathione lyase family enzyme